MANHAHSWFPISRKIMFMYCGRCGLINLKNKETSKAVAKPCPGRDDD